MTPRWKMMCVAAGIAASGAAQAQDVDIGAPSPPAEEALKPSAEAPGGEAERATPDAAASSPADTQRRPRTRAGQVRDPLPSAAAGSARRMATTCISIAIVGRRW